MMATQKPEMCSNFREKSRMSDSIAFRKKMGSDKDSAAAYLIDSFNFLNRYLCTERQILTEPFYSHHLLPLLTTAPTIPQNAIVNTSEDGRAEVEDKGMERSMMQKFGSPV